MIKNFEESQISDIVRSVLEEALQNRNITGDNLIDYLGTIPRGRFVTMGYINSEEISTGLRYVNADNYAKFVNSYTDSDEYPLQRKYLGNVRGDMEDYLQNGKTKTMKFNFNSDIAIVSYSVFQLNWLNAQGVAELEATKSDALQRLRKEHGFGAEGAEDTWRGKFSLYKTGKNAGEKRYVYGGADIMPIKNAHVADTSKFNQRGEEDERDIFKSEEGDVVFRQRPPVLVKKLYFLVDKTTGDVEVMNNQLFKVLKDSFGKKVENKVEDLEEDELAYKKALAQLNTDYPSAHTLHRNKTLWMSYTIERGNTKDRKRWVNTELLSQYQALKPYIGVDVNTGA